MLPPRIVADETTGWPSGVGPTSGHVAAKGLTSTTVFLVIGPTFTEASESEAVRYHARHFDRNITLITAGELKSLADEWSSQENKSREEPFPLGLLAATGRFDRSRLGKLL